jgi:hypothetical protein
MTIRNRPRMASILLAWDTAPETVSATVRMKMVVP